MNGTPRVEGVPVTLGRVVHVTDNDHIGADKHCSVAQMLVPEVKIIHEVRSGAE